MAEWLPAPRKGCKKGQMASNMLQGDSRRSKVSGVSATVAKDRGDGLRLPMAEIERHVGVTPSSIAEVVAGLEEEG